MTFTAVRLPGSKHAKNELWPWGCAWTLLREFTVAPPDTLAGFEGAASWQRDKREWMGKGTREKTLPQNKFPFMALAAVYILNDVLVSSNLLA